MMSNSAKWGRQKKIGKGFICKRCGNKANSYLKEVIDNRLCNKCRVKDDKEAYYKCK